MLGELSGEEKAHGGLDLSGRKGGFLVVSGELGRLGGESVEDIVDERVQDGHASLGDAGVRVHLLEHSVDVGGVRLDSLGASLATGACRLLCGDLCCLLANCGCLCHFDESKTC